MPSFLLVFICLILFAIITTSLPLPLRRVGAQKRVSPTPSDKRELILCWVVQIKTHATYSCGWDGTSAGAGPHGKHCQDDGGAEKGQDGRRECCGGSRVIRHHAAEIAKEVKLTILHSFEQFHDHFLLCHMLNKTANASPGPQPSVKSSSDTLFSIHSEHSDLKTSDKTLFEKYREDIERVLDHHEEILWFSSEHVHKHHSRSVIPPPPSSLPEQSLQQNVIESTALSNNDKPLALTTERASNPSIEINGMQDYSHNKAFLKAEGNSLNYFNIITEDNVINHSYNNENHIPQLHQANSLHSIKRHQKLFKFLSISDLPVQKNTDQPKTSSLNHLEKDFHPTTLHHQFKPRSLLRPFLPLTPLPSTRPILNTEKSEQSLYGLGSNLHLSSLKKRSAGLNSLDQLVPIDFNDPAYPKQWHLFNRQNLGMDINVTSVWQHNFTGSGITVCVVDDGIEWRNPDLKDNYNYKGSWDLNDNDHDPSPSSKKSSNHHGTRCAGEIAAVANNEVCGVGVAYGARVSGLRVLDGIMTDSLEAEAFNKKMDINDIYSCSWGPDDDGKTVDGPHLMAAKAMKYGVDFGREGFGSIFVVASGNGGANKDNCNFDGYANSIYTVTIGAVDEDGRMPYYAEECASMLGVTFSSGTYNQKDIVTTDWMEGSGRGCTEKHTGTSAAAPLAAGMIALMLQARPCLTWRDVQYIIILTGEKIDVEIAHWQQNGAGLSHSHKHGFGLLNAWRLVNAARVWQMVPWLTSYSYTKSDAGLNIPKGGDTALLINHAVTEMDIRGLSLFTLENVQVTIWLSHPCRGKLGVRLVSPAGTISVLATPRPIDKSSEGFRDWTFTTVRCWGETPVGKWTIQVIDHDGSTYGPGKVTKWRLTLFGTPMTPKEFEDRRQKVINAMSGKFLSSNHTLQCPPPPKYESVYNPVSVRTLKILILSGSFCLIMAVYESMEYIFCYNEEKKAAKRERELTRQAQRLASSVAPKENDTQGASVAGATFSGNDNNSNWTRGLDEDEDDEDDVFDASETSRLLSGGRSDGRISGANLGTPEVIPMSTFSVQEGRTSNNISLPPFDERDSRPALEEEILLNSR